MKEDMLGHACSMHGRVQKCVGLQNLIRKYDGRRYNRRLEDNIKNERIIRDSCGSEWGRVLGFFTYGFFFLLSEDSSDIGVVVTDLRHHRSLLGPAKIYPRNAMGFCNVIVRVSEWMNSFCYSRKNRRFWTWCLSVRPSLHMPREEKPTRCHWMVYCTYNILNMFRALLWPSSGDRDYMCVITVYSVRCLGCWLLEVRCRAAVYASGMRDVARRVVRHPSSWTHSQLPCTWLLTTSNQALHIIGGNNTQIVLSSWWWA